MGTFTGNYFFTSHCLFYHTKQQGANCDYQKYHQRYFKKNR